MAVSFENECFFISPIGKEGTPERERNDGVRDLIVRPAAEELGLHAVRADEIGNPGQITTQVIDHVLNAKAAVADVTGANPNVYYELAVRHAARLPVALISEDGLPFDLAQQRTIFFNTAKLATIGLARDTVVEHLRASLDGHVESPVSIAVDWRKLQEGSALERTLAEMVSAVEALAQQVQPRTVILHGNPEQQQHIDTAVDSASALMDAILAEGDPPDLRTLAPHLMSLIREVVEAKRTAPSTTPPLLNLPPLERSGLAAALGQAIASTEGTPGEGSTGPAPGSSPEETSHV
jgi:hypothetical protein